MADPRPPTGSDRAWWRTRGAVIGGVLAAVAAIVVVLVWFQPQTLLFDTVVEDEFPVADPGDDADDDADDPDVEVADPAEGDEPDAADDDGDTDDTAADGDDPDADDPDADDLDAEPEAEPASPVALATGSFESRNRYTVTGDATIHEIDGERILRLEDFESTNGPDLYVYLTAADHADDDEALDQDAIDLGDLRGNVGDQNYAIDTDVDLDHYDTVVIWCERFSTSFGAADLEPA